MLTKSDHDMDLQHVDDSNVPLSQNAHSCPVRRDDLPDISRLKISDHILEDFVVIPRPALTIVDSHYPEIDRRGWAPFVPCTSAIWQAMQTAGISFARKNAAPGTGINMAEFLGDNEEICDPHRPAFPNAGIDVVEFSIEWGAYPQHRYRRSLTLRGHRDSSITRDQLGRYIVVSYREFIQECASQNAELGMERWAFRPHGSLWLETLWLLSLVRTGNNEYEAVIGCKC
ncbi:hypothetical protein WOLCODRAFT_29610 [Wolfiporia cocos MD-104 SS10]|uniref:Uncharacterized protein n=1 Tax=Wolfiporia cocos (strain MD-104) TaxID=742152 RepID=A0A2H3JCC5_WOLCO|nr:hypothetical protein WOLCODRAFT_29610 [Wolfiporia cocos MD-104 SS10]